VNATPSVAGPTLVSVTVANGPVAAGSAAGQAPTVHAVPGPVPADPPRPVVAPAEPSLPVPPLGPTEPLAPPWALPAEMISLAPPELPPLAPLAPPVPGMLVPLIPALPGEPPLSALLHATCAITKPQANAHRTFGSFACIAPRAASERRRVNEKRSILSGSPTAIFPGSAGVRMLQSASRAVKLQNSHTFDEQSEGQGADDVALCSVVRAELLFGAERSRDPVNERVVVERFLEPFVSLHHRRSNSSRSTTRVWRHPTAPE